MNESPDYNLDDIRRSFSIIRRSPDQVTEIRSPKTRWKTLSGYSDQLDDLVRMAVEVNSTETVRGVYLTANPVNPALIALSKNRISKYAEKTTSDADIIRRYWFLVDIDPNPVAGVSSTDAEHEAAQLKAKKIARWLVEHGVPEASIILADSGNGAHVLVSIDLPNDDESKNLLEQCLDVVAFYFAEHPKEIDRTVYNAGRIWKIYGTKSQKGDNTEERPHRLSRLVYVPNQLITCPKEALTRVAELLPAKIKPEHNRRGNYQGAGVDVRVFIERNGIQVKFEKEWNDWTLFVLDECVFDPSHNHGEAYLGQHSGGAAKYECKHNSCIDKEWKDVRELFEPDYRASNAKRKKTKQSTSTNSEPSDAYPYGIEHGQIVRYQTVKENSTITVPLCNFTAEITEEIVIDDGAEAQRAFVLEGCLDTEATLSPARVPVLRFPAMNWVGESWGRRAIVNAGNTTKDHLRVAIQKLSPNARDRYVFTHTGWRKIDNNWIYLSGSGVLANNEFEVDLGSELARYRMPCTPDDPVGAMKLSLELLKIAPLRITAPLFAAIFRAPLCTAFSQDLALWLEGRTGSMKSTLAALILCHFGEFVRTTLPGNWESTANQLERRAFLLKDSLFVIDEYVPTGLNRREIETKASRILRGQGNLSGRNRLRSDLTERPAFYPRGIIISTGEEHPPGQSLLARTIVIELTREDIDIALLTELQAHAGRFVHSMAGYLQWLAPQMDRIGELLKETFLGTRARATAGNEHLRIPEAAAHLWLGVQSAMAYAMDIGAAIERDAEKILDDCWKAFIQIAKEQSLLVEEEQPTRRFLDVLHVIITQGRAVIYPVDTPADTPAIPEPKPGIDFIGWYDIGWLYLLPEASFKAVMTFCRDSGEYFSTSQGRLRRNFLKEGLSECDPDRLTKVVKIRNRSHRVLKLSLEAIQKAFEIKEWWT